MEFGRRPVTLAGGHISDFLLGPVSQSGPFAGKRMKIIGYETPTAGTHPDVLKQATSAQVLGTNHKVNVVPVYGQGGVIGSLRRKPLLALVLAGSGVGGTYYLIKKLRNRSIPDANQQNTPNQAVGGWS